jgi:hypothetical protein
MGLHRLVRAGLACAFVVAPCVAHAAPEDQKQRADQLYQDGRAAFAAGDYEKACPLLASYYEIEPSPGALFTLAECEARWGKSVRAVTHFEQFLWQTQAADQTSVQQQRVQMANDQLTRFSQRVAHLLPKLPQDAKGPVQVKLDGAPLTLPVAHAIVLEPGEHVLDVEGQQHVVFILAPAETKVLDVVAAQRAMPAEPRDSKQPPTQPEPQAPEQQPSRFTTPVIALGAIGAAGIVTGSIAGALVFSKKSDIDAHCVSVVCDHTGKQAADSAQTMATVSTVGFVVGAVALAAGAALYIWQPTQPTPQSHASVYVVPNGIGGAF